MGKLSYAERVSSTRYNPSDISKMEIECIGCSKNCKARLFESNYNHTQVQSSIIKAKMEQWKECRVGKEYDNESRLSRS